MYGRLLSVQDSRQQPTDDFIAKLDLSPLIELVRDPTAQLRKPFTGHYPLARDVERLSQIQKSRIRWIPVAVLARAEKAGDVVSRQSVPTDIEEAHRIA